MPDARKFYLISDDKCLFEGMTKEQIIAAIVEATGNTPTDVDEAFITKIKESNHNSSLTFWLGTQEQFNELHVVAPAYKVNISSAGKIYLTPFSADDFPAHASRHGANDDDPIDPVSIGAATVEDLDTKLSKSGGTMTGAVNMGGFSITNVNDPVNDADAPTKKYVDKKSFCFKFHDTGVDGNHYTSREKKYVWLNAQVGGVSIENYQIEILLRKFRGTDAGSNSIVKIAFYNENDEQMFSVFQYALDASAYENTFAKHLILYFVGNEVQVTTIQSAGGSLTGVLTDRNISGSSKNISRVEVSCDRDGTQLRYGTITFTKIVG